PLAIAASPNGHTRLMEVGKRRAEAASSPAGETTAPSESPMAAANRHRQAVDKHCGAGSSTLTVDPFGNVLPCVQWRLPVGNVHDARISEIWEHSPALHGVRATTAAVKAKLADLGEDGAFANFCPG